MATFNKITLIGYLGDDPKVNSVNDKKVANFNIATNKSYTNSQGERIENTTWFRISVWGRQAEVAEQYLKKGTQVYIEGELSTRDYTDQNGINRTTLEVLCSTFQLLGSRNDSQQSAGMSNNTARTMKPAPSAQERTPSYTQTNQYQADSYQDGEPEGDLPF